MYGSVLRIPVVKTGYEPYNTRCHLTGPLHSRKLAKEIYMKRLFSLLCLFLLLFFPSSQAETLPETEDAQVTASLDRFFDGALFLGDSLTRSLGNYVRTARRTEPDLMGTAQFLGAVGMSVKQASFDFASSVDVSYVWRGKPVSPTSAIRKAGAKAVYIMLGTNDLDCRTMDDAEKYYRNFIDVILEKCPGVRIVVQSVLPLTRKACLDDHLDVRDWHTFNERLMALCEEKQVDYLDVASSLTGEDGYLVDALCGDGKGHLNAEGSAIWVRVLHEYAEGKMDASADSGDMDNTQKPGTIMMVIPVP